MSKYICFVVWVVSLSCVSAAEGVKSAEDYEALREGCLKEYGTTEAEFMEAAKTGDVSKINPCYFGCYFKKIGLLNDKGQYDSSMYLKDLERIVKDSAFFDKLKGVAKKCESVKDVAVSDGEAGCEMGALLAACLFKGEKEIFSAYNAKN